MSGYKEKEMEGLRRKFRVFDHDTGDEIRDVTFTLVPGRDDWACSALLAYAKACEMDNPELAFDLRRLVVEARNGRLEIAT
jgi:hypothetical protein